MELGWLKMVWIAARGRNATPRALDPNPILNLSLSEERSAPTEGGAGRGGTPARRATPTRLIRNSHIPRPPLTSFDKQALSDSLHHTINIHQHFAVPEAHDGEPSLFD